MKLLLTVFFMLVPAVVHAETGVTVPRASPSTSLSADDQMQQLAEESQSAKPACERFSKDAKALLSEEHPSVQKLLAVVQSYPGTPVALQKANRLLRETPDPLHHFKLENVGALYDCKNMDYFLVSKKLIDSLSDKKTASGVSKDLQAQAVQSLLNNAERELTSPSTMAKLLLQSLILHRLAITGIDPKLSSQRKAIQSTFKKVEDLKKQVREEISKTPKDQTIQAWADESLLAKQGSDLWLPILKKR
jgi:hypothetical protein